MLSGPTIGSTGRDGSLRAAGRVAPGEGDRSERPVAPPGGPWSIAPGFLAVAVLVVLSLPRLGRRPLWLDEAYSIGATHDLAATWRGTGGTMGLYYLVLWPVAQLSTDRAWVRLPSLVFAAAAVLVVYEVGRRLGGRSMGGVAATMLAMAWPIGRYAVEARSYTLALLLVSLSWLGLVGAVQAGGGSWRRWWWLFGVATVLAPLAHGLAALHFVTQVLLLGAMPDRWRWWRACIPVAVGLAGVGALLFGVGAGEVASWIAPLNGGQIRTILHVLFGHGVLGWLAGALAATGGVLAVRAACRRGGGTEARLSLVPLFWAVGVPLLLVGISVFRPYAVGRYVIGALPGVALLVGSVLSRLRPAMLAPAAVVLAALLLLDEPATNSRYPEDWPALVERVAADGADGDRLLIRHELRGPLDYAWGELADDERPGLVPLSPTDPLDEVRRFYHPPSLSFPALLAADAGTPVWYVERDHTRLHAVVALLSDPAVESRYEVAGRWSFAGELYLVRLEPREPWWAVGLALGERLAPFAAGR